MLVSLWSSYKACIYGKGGYPRETVPPPDVLPFPLPLPEETFALDPNTGPTPFPSVSADGWVALA